MDFAEYDHKVSKTLISSQPDFIKNKFKRVAMRYNHLETKETPTKK